MVVNLFLLWSQWIGSLHHIANNYQKKKTIWSTLHTLGAVFYCILFSSYAPPRITEVYMVLTFLIKCCHMRHDLMLMSADVSFTLSKFPKCYTPSSRHIKTMQRSDYGHITMFTCLPCILYTMEYTDVPLLMALVMMMMMPENPFSWNSRLTCFPFQMLSHTSSTILHK